MSRNQDQDQGRLFEEYLRDGITAVRSGQRTLAVSLLQRAIFLNGAEARPYVWLSATTDDPLEQVEFLEKVVAIDPSNTAARRGLAVLNGKIDATRLVLHGAAPDNLPFDVEFEAESRSFDCPRCGGRMVFSLENESLTCEYCGFSNAATRENRPADILSSPADEAEQVLDFVVPTRSGHVWARGFQRLSCEHCTALSLVPVSQLANQCPYCGSNRVSEAVSEGELIQPQLIGLMKVSEEQARKLAWHWLGRGFLAPDDLTYSSESLSLRQAYYSFWTFDGLLEMQWTCEVSQGSGNFRSWSPVSGTEARFFDDVLVPGVKALSLQEIARLEPFDLRKLVAFEPSFLAGWPAVLYDRSLADASIIGRERVLKKFRPELQGLIEVGREKRNISIGASSWSGLTFKQILLPVWTGEYHFQGKIYRLSINGQSGKVGGEKPRDTLKIVLLILCGVLLLAGLYMLYLLLSETNPAF
jgi:Zn finger protein HypA/HybF involved in hydrogenase expression